MDKYKPKQGRTLALAALKEEADKHLGFKRMVMLEAMDLFERTWAAEDGTLDLHKEQKRALAEAFEAQVEIVRARLNGR